MGDIRLYRTSGKSVTEIKGSSIPIEKTLQAFIESHLDELLGIRFLKTEYPTTHGGRIDTLGIDKKGNPVILEYKRLMNQSVVMQGLSYQNWLVDHKGDFKLIVLEKFGKSIADKINWNNPRLLCIASDFSKNDSQALPQMSSRIELIRYKNYLPDLFILEWVSGTPSDSPQMSMKTNGEKQGHSYKTVDEYLASCNSDVKDRYKSVKTFAKGLGNDVQEKILKYYIAFKRTQNFMCVEFAPQTDEIRIFLKIDPKSIKLEKGFSRDVSNIGHYSSGDLQLTIRSDSDLEKAKPLITQSYDKT